MAEVAILCLRCFVPPACLGRLEARVLVVLGFLADARTVVDGLRLPSDHATAFSFLVSFFSISIASLSPKLAQVVLIALR